jgi:hypothetical protein
VAVALLASCATGRVSNLDAYDDVPMNRVVPYPSDAELSQRAHSVLVEDRPATDIDESLLEEPRAQVRRALERLVADVGARLVEPSASGTGAGSGGAEWSDEGGRPDDAEWPDEGAGSDDGGGVESEAWAGEGRGGADRILATRFTTYRYGAEWKKPFKMLWQTEEDIAGKPGTCTHRVEIGLDVELLDAGGGGAPTRTWTLEHSAVQKNKDLDPACTIASVTLSLLFETALDEALGCLDIPLGSQLLPRGHLTAHRKAPGAERHIYRVTLGSDQGLEPGDPVEIRREQRSTSPMGEEVREERVIAEGLVADLVQRDSSWIAIDPAKATEPLLDGDVVRPVLVDGLLASLSGPDCDSILTER